MNIRDRKAVKAKASALLQSANMHPGKLTLIHSGVTLGVSLVITLLGVCLQQGIAGTGGLSGIQTRSLLQTVQTMLNLAFLILQPFWAVGLCYSFLRYVRKESAETSSLLRGFHRFGPVLRLNLLKFGLMFLPILPCSYLVSAIMLNLMPGMISDLEPVLTTLSENPQADPMTILSQIPTQELLTIFLPFLICCLGLYLIVIFLMACYLRFTDYLILDDPKIGAISAIRNSIHMMKRNFGAMFMLDLSYWWYILLQLLAVGIMYLDLILSIWGISMPFSPSVNTLICYSSYTAVSLVIHYTFRPKMEAAYASVYDYLRNSIYFPHKLEQEE